MVIQFDSAELFCLARNKNIFFVSSDFCYFVSWHLLNSIPEFCCCSGQSSPFIVFRPDSDLLQLAGVVEPGRAKGQEVRGHSAQPAHGLQQLHTLPEQPGTLSTLSTHTLPFSFISLLWEQNQNNNNNKHCMISTCLAEIKEGVVSFKHLGE